MALNPSVLEVGGSLNIPTPCFPLSGPSQGKQMRSECVEVKICDAVSVCAHQPSRKISQR